MSYANASSFIDQNLAAQLFIAARAHDSLRHEPDHLLPSTIADIFTTTNTKSHQYRTTTYGALGKQHSAIAHGQLLGTAGGTLDKESDESQFLLLLHNEPRIMKLINSFLGMNDKQSLMFAVTEDRAESEQAEEETSDLAPSMTLATNTSLAEDMFHREQEELSILRAQYLTQLAHTRELESRTDDLQQQLDRTRCIMTNTSSGDLMLLQHTAGRLHLLRELTSRTFDDFFSARAQYSSWCRAQQNAYKAQAKRSLAEIKVKSEVARAAQEDALLKCRQFLKDITVPPTADATAASTTRRRRLSLSRAPPPSPQVSFSAPLAMSFQEQQERAAAVLAAARERNSSLCLEFQQSSAKLLQQRRTKPPAGEKQRKETKRGGKNPLFASLPYVTSRNNDGDGPDVSPVPTASPVPLPTPGPSLESRLALSRPVLSKVVLSNRRRARARVGAGGGVAMRGDAGSLLATSPSPKAEDKVLMSTKYPSLDSLRDDVSKELQLFEQNVCSAMEHISSLAMTSVQKKFIGMEARQQDLPLFVTDTKWRIDEKSALVSGAAEYADAIKDNLASDFDGRVRKSYGSFLEQQMKRLQRIQGYCDNLA